MVAAVWGAHTVTMRADVLGCVRCAKCVLPGLGVLPITPSHLPLLSAPGQRQGIPAGIPRPSSFASRRHLGLARQHSCELLQLGPA